MHDDDLPAGSESAQHERELIERARELAKNSPPSTPGHHPAVPRDRSSNHRPLGMSSDTVRIDEFIGRYRIVDELGAGGMGIVYLAEQTYPIRRQVALKVVQPYWGGRDVLARFEAERQALAMMNHPNVARVYDAGATDRGRPYFVMEYVNGVSLTTYCDEQRTSTQHRLELFVKVCQAVHHAHQKGIIHRDIKPSNILVAVQDGQPVPKVIDFGVAKALNEPLTERTLVTGEGQLLGTLPYMSPEQVDSTAPDIDTRTDIYSLGVLLYELLSGSLPVDCTSLSGALTAELPRIIREQEPLRPSRQLSLLSTDRARASTLRSGQGTGSPHTDTLPRPTDSPESLAGEIARRRCTSPSLLIRALRGDLDWITMKCLEKDRARRYSSVAELAADIERHLHHEPVLAGPPGASYRLQKFVRRHRTPVLIATIFMALLSGLGAAVMVALDRAQEAHWLRRESRLEMKHAYAARAQAIQHGGQIGRQFESLKALRKAAAIQPSAELRDAAIAAIALFDLELVDERPLEAGIRNFAIAPARQLYASVAPDGTIGLHRLSDDRRISQVPNVEGRPSTLRFSPNGRYLGVKYEREAMTVDFRLWNLETIEPIIAITEIQNEGWYCDFDFTPDSAVTIVGFENGKTRVYAIPSGELLNEFVGDLQPHSLRVHPNGRWIAVSSVAQQVVRVRDLKRGEIVYSFSPGAGIREIDWGGGGTLLAGAGDDYGVYLWDIQDSRRNRILRTHQAELFAVTFNNRGDLLVSRCWGGETCFWDTIRGQRLLTMQGSNAGAVWFSPDDRLFGAARLNDGMLRSWRLSSQDAYRTLAGHREGKGPKHVSFDRPGILATSSGADGVRIWHTPSGLELGVLPIGLTWSVSWSPDGRSFFTSGSHGIHRWPIKHTAGGLQLGPPRNVWTDESTRYADLSHDGRFLAAIIGDDRVVVLSVEESEPEVLLDGHQFAKFVAVSPNGRWVATGTWHGTGVQIWDMSSGHSVVSLPVNNSANVAFSPNGRWLLTGTGTEYGLWETGSWRRVHTIPRHSAGAMPGRMAFSPDGRFVFIADTRRVVRLIDVETGHPLATFKPPDAQDINWLALSSDGHQLAAATGSGFSHVWNLTNIRRQLDEMDLDWNAPLYPAAALSKSQEPPSVTVLLGNLATAPSP